MNKNFKFQISNYRRVILALIALIIVGVGLLKLIPSRTASAAWFNAFWAFRKAINIANSSGAALANFQVSFTVDTTDTTKFQSDCDDIRITDANGKLLPHWVEEGGTGACGLAATKVWVKVPSLPVSGQTIYLYYGNPSATNAASGNSVFEFFDTFNGNSVDSSQWTFSGSPTLTGGTVSLSSSAALASKSTKTDSSGLGNLIFRAKQAATTLTGAKIGFSNTSNPSTHSNTDDAAMAIVGSTEEQISQTSSTSLISHHQLEETTTTDANQFKASGYLDTGKLSQAVSMYGNAAGTQGSTLTFNRGTLILGNNYEHYNGNQGTISFWIKPNWNGNDGVQRFFLGGGYGNVDIFTYTNSLNFRIGSNHVAAGGSIASWTLGTWYHVTARWDADNTLDGTNYSDIYVNGVSLGGNTTAITAVAPPTKLYIGSYTTEGFSAGALIDDFAIYDRVLTTAEIATLYGNGTTTMVEAGSVADPSLKFYAKMDGTGTLSPVTYNAAGTADQKAYNATTNTNGQMVADWNMETAGVASWTDYTTPTTKEKVTDTNILFDTQSLHVITDAEASYEGTYQTWKASASVGENYHIEAWVKVATGKSMRVAVGQGAFDQYLTDSSGTSNITSTTWTKVSTDFKVVRAGGQTIYFSQPNNTPSEFYVDNVVITPNSVDNGGTEGGATPPAGWTAETNATVESGTSEHSGTYEMKITAAAANVGATQNITLVSGNYYLVSGWARATSGDTATITMDKGDTTTQTIGTVTATAYTKVSGVFKATGTAGVIYLRALANTDIVWFDDVSVIPLDNTALSFKAWTPVNDTPGANSAELLSNTGFETAGGGGTDIWGSWTEAAGDSTLTDETSIINNGGHALKWVSGTTRSGSVTQTITVVPGNTYIYSFWTKGDGTTAGRYAVYDVSNASYLIADGTSTGVSGTTYTLVSGRFTAPTGCVSARFVVEPGNLAGATSYFDDISIKLSPNPLSVHGSSTGVGSTSPGARNDAYKFDGSTGYLRQKTYAVNIGTLSYLGDDTTTAEFSDDGQTFTSYQTAAGSAYAYMIVVTNSDNTTSWGYLGASDTANHINIHTAKGSATRGWNGTAPVAGTKTPVGYEIRKTDYQITGNAITVGAWIKPTSTSSTYVIAQKGNTGGQFLLETNGQNIEFKSIISGWKTAASTTNPISSGNWYHVLGTYDGSYLYVYLNGTLLGTSALATGGLDGSVDYIPFAIGARLYASVDQFFPGSIDSPFVISSALSEDQVKDIYNSTASHYGLTTNNATVNTQPANSASPTTDANTYHNYTLTSQTSLTSLTQDGTTIATSTTNLPNSAMYVRLQNADTANTLTVDWLAVTKYAATTPSAVVSATEEQSQGPAAYWKFDEGQGSTANDSTANKNNGSLGTGSSAPTWQTEDLCVSGKCLKFDGSNDYVDGGTGSSLNITGSVTMETWVKPNSLPTYQATYWDIIGKAESGKGYGIFLDSAAAPKFRAHINGQNTTSSYAAITNQWTHLAVVYNTSNIYLYANGVLQTTDPYSTDTSTTANSFKIGDGDYFGGNFNGFLDDVKIYPYARTAAQILADYNSGKTKASSSEGIAAQLGTNDQSLDALSNGLVGYWKQDEASWVGAAGEVIDSSGNGNNGQAVGPTHLPTTAGAKFGNGGVFDGTEDYVTKISPSSLPSGQSPRTISVWVKPDSVNPGGTIVALNSAGNPNQSFILQTSYVSPSTYLFTDGINSNNNIRISGDEIASVGIWNHIVFVFDGSTGWKYYLNGVNKKSGNFVTTINTTITDIEIGRRGDGANTGYYWPGSIDDVRIYNRALSPSEVRQLYNWAPGPVAQYTFDEGSGGTVNDISGNNNVGTWNGTGTTHWTTGKIGKAGKFNGSDDYVRNTSNLIPSGNFTYTAWFNTRNAATSQAIVNLRGTEANGTYIGTRIVGSKLVTYIDGGTALTGTTTLSNNTWYFLSVTYNSSASPKTIVALNTVQEVTGTTNAVYTWDQTLIGARTTTTLPFNGLIDDVRIYNYARSAKQIVEDMNAGHPAVGSPVGSAVGYWKFDEGYGTNANNSGNGGSALNGSLGTGSSAPAWNQNGKFGKALQFDGGEDYVTIGSSLNVPNELTISAWINTNTISGPASKAIVADCNAGGSTQQAFLDINRTAGKVSALWGNSVIITSNQTLSINTWYHVVLVRSGTTGSWTAKLYINGILDKSATTSINPSSVTSWSIGKGGAYNGMFFNGLIDEVKVYNYALTEDEVKLDYNKGSAMVLGSLSDTSGLSGGSVASQSASAEYCIPGDTATCNAPVGRWSFDTGSGSSVPDETGNGNTGTWNGTGSHWTTGKIGKAGKFNGSSDYVNVGHNSTLDVDQGPFTYEVWLRATSTTGGRNIFGRREDATHNLWIYLVANQMSFNEAGLNDLLYTPSFTIADGVWRHYAFVYDLVSNSTILYINGAEVKEVSQVGKTPGEIPAIRDTYIGCYISTAYFTQGNIDEARIFNYARTPAQIAWDYNRGKPVAQWKFDECQGTIIHSSNDPYNSSLNGTLTIGTSGSNPPNQNTAGTCTDGLNTSAWYNGASGKYNASLKYDGADDYTQVTDTANLRFDANTADFSLFAWTKRTTTGTEYIISKEDADNDGYRLMFNASNQVLCSEDATDVTSTSIITDTNWHLIGCTIDRDGNGEIYIDGRADGATVAMGTDAMATTSNIRIATRSYTSANWFNGQMDEVQIYNYALTAQQVKTLYNQNSAVRFGPNTGIP